MPKPPILKPRQVARILMKMGFIELRQRGSHRQFAHPDGRFTTLADHGEDIRPNHAASDFQRCGRIVDGVYQALVSNRNGKKDDYDRSITRHPRIA